MGTGDHIRARKGGRWVHGIDCGDRTVIFFAAGNGAAPAVRRVPWAEFSSGAEEVGVVAHTERSFPPKGVVARAFSRSRESALSWMFGDSEQFATWCKIGRLSASAAPLRAPGASPRKAAAISAKPRKAAPARATGKRPATARATARRATPKKRAVPRKKTAPRATVKARRAPPRKAKRAGKKKRR